MSNNTTDYPDYYYNMLTTDTANIDLSPYLDYTSRDFQLISSILITIISLIGNLLVAFILLRLKEFKKEPIFRYLLFAAINDLLNCIFIWPMFYPDYFLINQFDISCKLFSFIITVLQQLSSWINVVISIDTYVMVKYPADYHKRKNVKFQVIILSAVFFILCFLNVPWAYFPIVVLTIICYVSDPLIVFYLQIYKNILQILIPCILMLVFSSLTHRELTLKKKIMKRHNILRKQKNLFKTSLIFNVSFFICNISNIILFIISFVADFMFSQIISDIFMAISYFFYSFDFFIYLISNRIFREYFFSLFNGCRKK